MKIDPRDILKDLGRGRNGSRGKKGGVKSYIRKPRR